MDNLGANVNPFVMNPFVYHELTEIAALLEEILKELKELKEVKENEHQQE